MRELPHFLLGQSMGGAVALKVHLKQQKEWDGVLLVAPMCKVFLKLLTTLIESGDWLCVHWNGKQLNKN